MRDALRTIGRLLVFRATRDELVAVGWRHLAVGLGCTWLVGIGRSWDKPEADVFRHSGVGSVLYVIALALVVFALVWPLRPPDWSYRRVLTFVTLVAPPAALYAIPVERLLAADVARRVNFWFLALVAVWRVALLLFYLRRVAKLSALEVVTTGLLPLTVIVSGLFALNLDRVVFDIMGGGATGAGGDAYMVLFALTSLSVVAVWPLLVAYLALVVAAWLRRRRSSSRP